MTYRYTKLSHQRDEIPRPPTDLLSKLERGFELTEDEAKVWNAALAETCEAMRAIGGKRREDAVAAVEALVYSSRLVRSA